jgi:hypothetical protein
LRLGVPISFLVIGLVSLCWIAAEMHLGKRIRLVPESGRVAVLALCAASFLFFIWWIFTMIHKAKTAATHGQKRN